MSDNFSLMKTGAKLRFDGVYECGDLDQVVSCMLDGVRPPNIYSNIPEVKNFNNRVDTASEFAPSTMRELSHSWKIPEYYLSLDVYSYVLHKLDEYDRIHKINYQEYMDRLCFEMDYFENANSMEFLKTIIFLLQEMTDRNLFWGVGRGSSCASLVLFLIDLHKIDPIKFKIPEKDFFK